MPLTAQQVSETAIEGSVNALFQEWLKGYFDGSNHAVGYNAPQKFPNAVLTFQQSSVPQPLDGAAISLVWIHRAKPRYFWDTVGGRRQRLALVDAGWLFIVRAQIVDSGQGNSKKLGQDTSDLLFAILQNEANTQPLAQKGIHRLRPEFPQIMSEGPGAKPGDPGYVMRSVTCTGRLRYHVLTQPTT